MASATSVPGLDAFANTLGLTIVDSKGTTADVKEQKDANDESSGKDTSEKPTTTEQVDSDAVEEEKGPRAPPGTLISSVNIYKGDNDDTWTDKEPEDTKPAENEETASHAIVLRNQKSEDSRKKYELHSIVIQSSLLKQALSNVLKGYPDVFCDLDRLVFPAPFEPFIHRWGDFIKFINNEKDETTKKHLELLHSVLKHELRDTIKAFEDYVKHGVVTYDHAWTIFQPGAVLMRSTHGQMSAMKLSSAVYTRTQCGNVYRLFGEVIEWDGDNFGWSSSHHDLREFKGVKKITELSIFPLAFLPRKNSARKPLIERGRKFASLAGYHYQSYKGTAFQPTDQGWIPISHSGRIIVDTSSWNKQSHLDSIWVNSLTKADDEHVDGEDAEEGEDATNGVKPSNDLVLADNHDALAASPEEGEPEVQPLNDYQCMLCTPFVRGYSIKIKRWLHFAVQDIADVRFSQHAFDGLVLAREQKSLILALAKAQTTPFQTFDDVIEGKGLGMCILLSGPPGVGKTLTAEAVSEHMRVPLYMMSAGDLGIKPDEVEQNLRQILEMVARWRAILLIDECDVFLEARSVHDLERNKLVSIFLRLLEYYDGTLFMTTNRVQNIDTAFQSRIHIHMAYPDLVPESREKIWTNFLKNLTIPCNISNEEVKELAAINLNGRQIKNLIKTAYLLALEAQQPMTKKEIDTVLAIERGAQFGPERLTMG